MTHPFFNPELLNNQEVDEISGGAQTAQLRVDDPRPAIRPQDPPRHYTQAIGEGGGYQPDLY